MKINKLLAAIILSLFLNLSPEYVCAMDEEFHEEKGGLYFSKYREQDGQFYFEHRDRAGEEDHTIINIINKTPLETLLQQYPTYIEIFETTLLSSHMCHEYALAKMFGYQEIPSWINILALPSMFDCAEYFESTPHPHEGDLVVYYNGPAAHFGIMGSCGRVISTWGKASESALVHAPFFADGTYGSRVIVWTPKKGKTSASIRSEIEQKLMDKELTKVHVTERDEVQRLVKELQTPKLDLSVLLLLPSAIVKIDAFQRQEVVEVVKELNQYGTHYGNITYSRLDLVIDTVRNISKEKRTLVKEAVKSLINRKGGKLLIHGNKDSVTKEVFSEKCIINILSTLNKMDKDVIPSLIRATQMLIKPSMDGKNICDILEGLEPCSKQYDIAPEILANTAYPLFVNDMCTSNIDILFTIAFNCIKAGKEDKIAEFVKSKEINSSLLSLGGSFVAHRFEAFNK